MASKEADAKKHEDSSTKHVLDYYKKFSQNKDLPKYFSGTSVSYLPKFQEKVDEYPTDIIIKTDVDVDIIITTEDDEKRVEEHEDISRASSALSNRKLEWDSLADIGYDNLQKIDAASNVTLKRSSSLPLVLEDYKLDKIDAKFLIDKADSSNKKQESKTNDNVRVFICNYSSSSASSHKEQDFFSSSSSPPEEKKSGYTSSSSSDPQPDRKYTSSSEASSTRQHISNFADTLSYLKKKVGLPEAHSTPNVDEVVDKKNISDTPVSKKLNKPVKNIIDSVLKKSQKRSNSSRVEEKNLKKPSKKMNTKVVNLCVTKPISLECIDCPQEPKTEAVETKKQTTIGIQTETITEKELIKIITKTQDNLNQSVVIYQHSDSNGNTCSTQTDSNAVASKCDSFEYVQQIDIKKTTEVLETKVSYDFDNIIPDLQKVTMKCSNLQRSQRQDDLRLEESEDSPSSDEIVLSKAASANDKINEDISNKIYLMQKLLKSKKYDESTKKRYVKKIIQKITESKYWDESSNSSDLFYPKKSKENAQKLTRVPISSNSSSSSSPKGILKKPNLLLSDEKIKESTRKRNLEIKTTVHEILPENAQKDDFTTSASEILPVDSLSKNKINKDTNSESQKSSNNTSLEKQYESSVNSKHLSYQNWKDDKTVSEKLFEERFSSSGDGDYVTHIASKEREHQLNWINNEIDHLGKIKMLLECHKNNLNNPNVPKGPQKTTSVYFVSEDKKKDVPRKKYVIQTEVTASIGGPTSRRFQVDGTKYTIEDHSDGDNKRSRGILRDIEVTASDTTTNIKVKTFCEECKRAPCVCVTEFLECVRNPFVCQKDLSTSESSKENICLKCENIAPICTCVKSNRTICLVCHKIPCVCIKNESKTGAISKRCWKCSSYPCQCFQQSNKFSDPGQPDYVGQFISVAKSNKSKGSSIQPDCCTICRKYHCLCEEEKKMASKKSSQKSDVTSKTKIDDNSLKGVFQNCQCSFHKKCNCEFVDKLLRHFDKEQNKKEENNVASKDIQVENVEKKTCQHIGVQTSVDTGSKKTQASTDEGYKLLQTESLSQNIGIQFQSSTIHQNEQTPDEFIPYRTQPEKLVHQKSSQTEESKESKKSQISEEAALKKIVQTQTKYENLTHLLFGQINLNQQTKKIQSERPKSAETPSTTDKIIQTQRPKSADAQTALRSVAFKEIETDKQKERSAQGVEDQIKINRKTQSQKPTSTNTQTNLDINIPNRENATQSERPVSEVVQTGNKPGASYSSQTEKVQVSQQLQTDGIGFVSEFSQMETVTYRNEAVQTSGSDNERRAKKIKCVGSECKKDVSCQCSPLRSNSPVNVERKKVKSRSSSVTPVSNEAKKVKESPRSKRSVKRQVSEVSASYDKSKGLTGSSSNDFTTNVTDFSLSTSPTTTSNLSSYINCICCKRPTPLAAIGILKQNNEEFPFCARCIKAKPILTTICYSGSKHICTCMESETTGMGSMRSARVQEYCTCIKPYSKRHTQYCSHCQNKLQRTVKSKSGIAYCLTLQCESPSKFKSKKKKKKQLEEIKVKIPGISHRKLHKDKENFTLKDNRDSRNDKKRDQEKLENSGEERIGSRQSKMRVGSREAIKSRNEGNEQKEKESLHTLQEYLILNRPDFIDSAEYRRRAVLSSKLGRTITKDEEKLRFLEENLQNGKLKKEARLFTEKEMREITNRNYKKLPEVQQKIKRSRDQRLKNADKFIVNTFTKKLQGCILKGRSRFPIDRKVVEMH